MPIYQDVFGGANIYPSDVTYRAIALTANVTLEWPEETATATNLVARIMDVTPSGAGFSITMPDARGASTGETVLWTNLGADSFEVRDNDGVSVITTVAAGEAWQIYLRSNSTNEGSWGSVQYGAYLSQANAAALAGTGLATSGSQLVTNTPVNLFSGNYSAAAASRAQAFVFTGTAANFTAPDPVVVGNGWYVEIQNSGTGGLTIVPGGSATVNGEPNKVLDVGDSCTLITDGLNFYTIGFGQAAEFAFDNISINVAGTGNYTLAGSELNRISYNFTGLLTGNRDIIIPTTIQQYWIRNSTTGSFTLTVKVLGQPGVSVVQGGASILYCNGVDAISADTGGIAVPVAVAEGGTGATTAGGARTNLGAGATGDALFTSSTQAQAWAALGTAPSGVVNGGTF